MEDEIGSIQTYLMLELLFPVTSLCHPMFIDIKQIDITHSVDKIDADVFVHDVMSVNMVPSLVDYSFSNSRIGSDNVLLFCIYWSIHFRFSLKHGT